MLEPLLRPQKSWLAALLPPRPTAMLLHHARRLASAAPGPGPRAPRAAEPVSGPVHRSWQPLSARGRALWATSGGGFGGVAGGGGGAAAFASSVARPRPPPQRDTETPSPLPTASEQPQQQQQQQYALGQVMTAQANFVRVRLHRALPPGAELPPLGDREGDEALLRLWRGGGGGGSGEGGPSSPQQPTKLQHAAHHPSPLLLCTVRGILKKLGQPVLVGDRVVVATTAAAAAAAGLLPPQGPPPPPAAAPSAAATTTPTTAAAKKAAAAADRGVVARVLPPSRPPLRDPPVANADHVVLLLSLAQPPFEPLAASRFLVSVAAAGLPVTVALNKCDLVGPEEAGRRAAQVRSWGYGAPGQVVCVSCESGEGLAALARRLGGGRTSVVAGPSGAGKSSMINALLALGGSGSGGAAIFGEAAEEQHMFDGDEDEEEEEDDDDLFGRRCSAGEDEDDGGGEHDDRDNDDDDDLFGLGGGGGGDNGDDDATLFDAPSPAAGRGRPAAASAATAPALAVGAVSARSGRGKHTTRTVTLVPVPAAVLGDRDEQEGEGGLLADTPGFSMPSLDDVPSAGLGRLFPDFEAAQQRRRRPQGGGGAGAAEDDAAAASASFSTASSGGGDSGGGDENSSGCRFTDCLHVSEPGCAVLAAVEAALDGPGLNADAEDDDGDGDAGDDDAPPGATTTTTTTTTATAAYVDPERLEHYYRFLAEAKAREADDVRAMQEAKRRREGATKAVVGRGGAVRQEARLDSRKHRVVSRRSGKQEAARAMMSDEEEDDIGRDEGEAAGRAEKGARPARSGRSGGGGGGGGGRGRRGGKSR